MTEPLPYSAAPSGERRCFCVRDHRPEPRELHHHHVWPLSAHGPNVAANLRWVCPTTHATIHKLWREYAHHGGPPPPEILRGYSAYVRGLVTLGWTQAHPPAAPPL